MKSDSNGDILNGGLHLLGGFLRLHSVQFFHHSLQVGMICTYLAVLLNIFSVFQAD